MLFAETEFGFVPLPNEVGMNGTRNALLGISEWSRSGGIPSMQINRFLTGGEAALDAVRHPSVAGSSPGALGGVGAVGAQGWQVKLRDPSTPPSKFVALLPWLLFGILIALWVWSQQREAPASVAT